MKLTKVLRAILEDTIDCALTKKLRLRTETEDRLNSLQGQEQIAKYGKVPPGLQSALDGTKDIPVDVSPVFSFADDLK